MANKVPIFVENIAFERLNLSRHYVTVDCDFTCYLVLNPSGSIPSEGTDICALHVGAWQIDAWTLLTKKDFPNQAGFSACLVWDKTLVSDITRRPSVVESDIDTANSVSTLKGQPVNITGFSVPDGSSLPVSMVSGGSEPISVENPLFVRNVQKRFYRFLPGNSYSLSDFLEVGAVCDEVVDGVGLYLCSPNAYFARFTGAVVAGEAFSMHWGKGMQYIGSTGRAFPYDPIRIFLKFYRNEETGRLNSIAFDGIVLQPNAQGVTMAMAREVVELIIFTP